MNNKQLFFNRYPFLIVFCAINFNVILLQKLLLFYGALQIFLTFTHSVRINSTLFRIWGNILLTVFYAKEKREALNLSHFLFGWTEIVNYSLKYSRRVISLVAFVSWYILRWIDNFSVLRTKMKKIFTCDRYTSLHASKCNYISKSIK